MDPAAESTALRRRARRDALLDEFRRCDLSARQFCRDRGVCYPTFLRWMRQAQSDPTPAPASPPASQSQFRELAVVGWPSGQTLAEDGGDATPPNAWARVRGRSGTVVVILRGCPQLLALALVREVA